MPLRLLNALLPRNQPRIHFYDEPFFPGLKGHKRILIHLKFRSDNCIEFSLSRRNPVKTLKNIALKAVSSNVSHSERIYNMDIPDDHLKMSLMQDFHNDWIKWARKKFPRKTYLLPYAESLCGRGRKKFQSCWKKFPLLLVF